MQILLHGPHNTKNHKIIADENYVFSLQFAKDPNIYWPIVHYYGSVYSALNEILDGKTVDSIFKNIPEFTPLPDRGNIVDEEQFVIKYGHNSCANLDWEFEFKQCSRCNLRRYSIQSCQKLDWKLYTRSNAFSILEWRIQTIRDGLDKEDFSLDQDTLKDRLNCLPFYIILVILDTVII